MKKVVIDTQTFVGSFLGGEARQVIDRWHAGLVQLCLSNVIMEEYLFTLHELGLRGEHELAHLLTVMSRSPHVIFSAKTPRTNIVNIDPGDQKFFACAVSLQAAMIIASDSNLLAIKNYMNIKIISPTDFLQLGLLL